MKLALLAVFSLFPARGLFAASPAPMTEAAFAARLSPAKTLAAAASANADVDGLLRMLDSSDSALRIRALDALKRHVFSSGKARQGVLAVFKDIREDADIRYKAAKTLSFAAMYGGVREALLQTAKTASESADLRKISYKALHAELSRDPSARSPLVGELVAAVQEEADPVVRRGAIWALYPVSSLSFVRGPLSHIALWDRDADARVEAFKSLYRAMADKPLQEAVIKTATDKTLDRKVRFPAVLLLSAVRTDAVNELFLRITADTREDRMIRTAATIAFDRENDHLKIYFRLPHNDAGGEPRDPLEYE